jgi:CRISPR-associated endonuclease Csn1
VHTTEGNVTAKLRELWGWDDVLMNLQLSKYKELGQTEMKEWVSDHGKRKHQKEIVTNWTKRDDHRHHAIDALVIACTKQGFIQRINTLNADETKDEMNKAIKDSEIAFKEKLDTLSKYLVIQKPFSTKDVETEADKILVSFKAGKKVATKGVRKIKKDGKKVIAQRDILIPRGALHEQSVNGKIKVIQKDKNIKYLFENADTIVNMKTKELVLNKLIEFDNDIKNAITSLKKNPIYLNEEKKIVLEKADCFVEETVLKYPIQSITIKDLPYIVDGKVKQLIKARLEEHNGKEKEAFKTTLWLNEKKQIPINSVRLFTKLSAIETVKRDKNGKEIGFVIPGNNHHIAIYKDEDGKFSQHACTFWHAIERKQNKLPIIINHTEEVWSSILNSNISESNLNKLPADKLELVHSMQQNEMFVLGLSKEETEVALTENNKPLLSKHLYLVWSVSENNFWFRHHLETKNSDLKKIEGAKESKRYYLFKSVGAFLNANPKKVIINHLGEIIKIVE